MQILINKDKVVFFAANEIHNTDEYVVLNGNKLFMSSDTYDKVEVTVLPNHYINGKFKYVDDKFEYVNPDDEVADKWIGIRNQRDILLQESDKLSGILWADLWASKSDANKTAWITYRKALRDIPETYTNPDEVVWPVVPGTE